MTDFIFVFLSVFTVLCALGTILSRNVVNGAMCLLLCLIGVAGLFVRLDAFLLAFLLLLVYAGAVVALFLFIIMLLDVHGLPAGKRRLWSVVGGVAAGGLLAAGFVGFLVRGQLPEPRVGEAGVVGATLKSYAESLFTTYLLPVEVIGFLLLVAMIGVIVLSQKSEQANPAMIASGLNAYLALSLALFLIGFLGVLLRRNTLVIFMSLELMLVAATLALVAFSRYNGTVDGDVFVFFILTVAAAEVAVGLAIIVALFRQRQTVRVDELDALKH